MVKTKFYVNDKCIWVKESPVKLTNSEENKTVKMLKEDGYGVVDSIVVIKGA